MLIRLADHFRPNRDMRYPHKGIVVDNQDPLRLGRVKCLIAGLLPDREDLVPGTDVADVDGPLITAAKYQSLPWISQKTPPALGGRTDSGGFWVPEVDAELTIEFPWEDIYFGFYTGYWQSATTHQGIHNDGYPDSYGFHDKQGTGWRVDKGSKLAEFLHTSGIRVQMNADGDLSIQVPGTISVTTPDGESGIIVDGETGQVSIKSADQQVIDSDLKIDNKLIEIESGSWDEVLSGSKEIKVGGGYKRLVGGSDSISTGADSNKAYGGNESLLVGGSAAYTYGTGFEAIVALGNYVVETKIGDIELKSLLANLKIPISGIAELDGLLVKIAGGDQSMLLGQDTVDWLMNHIHPTGVGPSGVPTTAAQAVTLLSVKAFNG
jgi:hypothetical protein